MEYNKGTIQFVGMQPPGSNFRVGLHFFASTALPLGRDKKGAGRYPPAPVC